MYGPLTINIILIPFTYIVAGTFQIKMLKTVCSLSLKTLVISSDQKQRDQLFFNASSYLEFKFPFVSLHCRSLIKLRKNSLNSWRGSWEIYHVCQKKQFPAWSKKGSVMQALVNKSGIPKKSVILEILKMLHNFFLSKVI